MTKTHEAVGKAVTAPVNQPALTTLLTGAVVATVNVIALVADWSGELTASVNIAAGAWVGVLGYFLHRVLK